MFMGWNGAASVDRVPSQFPYLISGGIAGLCFVVVGVGVLVVQNQRADRAALQATMQELIRVMRDDDEVVDTGFELPRRGRPRPVRPDGPRSTSSTTRRRRRPRRLGRRDPGRGRVSTRPAADASRSAPTAEAGDRTDLAVQGSR